MENWLICMLKKRGCGSNGRGFYGFKVETGTLNLSTVKPPTENAGTTFMGLEIG